MIYFIFYKNNSMCLFCEWEITFDKRNVYQFKRKYRKYSVYKEYIIWFFYDISQTFFCSKFKTICNCFDLKVENYFSSCSYYPLI